MDLQSLGVIDEFPIIAIISFLRIPLLRKLDSRDTLRLALRAIRKRTFRNTSDLNVEQVLFFR